MCIRRKCSAILKAARASGSRVLAALFGLESWVFGPEFGGGYAPWAASFLRLGRQKNPKIRPYAALNCGYCRCRGVVPPISPGIPCSGNLLVLWSRERGKGNIYYVDSGYIILSRE